MAEVRLWINPRENAIYDLPRVCMKCGDEAPTFHKIHFSWYPPWISVLFLLGIWPFLIAAWFLIKWQTVEVPLCDKHRHHWMQREVSGVAAFFFLLVLGFVLLMLLGQANGQGNGGEDFAPFLCLGWSFLIVVLAVVLGIYHSLTTIRATQITDRDITLTNVSPVFVRALVEEKAALERDIDRVVEDRWQRGRRGDPPPERSTDITEGEPD